MRICLNTVVILLLACFSAHVYCNPDYEIYSRATHANTDLSLYYLGSLFGNVGNVLSSNNGQMLGQLFYRFNIGIIVAGTFLISYMVMMQAFRVAFEGTAMPQQRPTMTIALRVAIGFALLVPNQSTGYSIAQELLMKVVVESVSFADMTWEGALNFICYGQMTPSQDTIIGAHNRACPSGKNGVLWSPPTAGGGAGGAQGGKVTTSDITKDADFSKYVLLKYPSGWSADLRACSSSAAKDSFCYAYGQSPTSVWPITLTNLDKSSLFMRLFVYQVQSYADQIQAKKNSNSGQLESFIPREAEWREQDGVYVFPSGPQQNEPTVLKTEELAKLLDTETGGDSGMAAAKQVYRVALSHLSKAAKEYLCSDKSLREEGGAEALSWCRAMSYRQEGDDPIYNLSRGRNFWLAYSSLVTAAVSVLNTPKPATANLGTNYTSFIHQAREDGWLMAGAFYWNLTRVVAAVSGDSSSDSKLDKKLADDFKLGDITAPGGIARDANNRFCQNSNLGLTDRVLCGLAGGKKHTDRIYQWKTGNFTGNYLQAIAWSTFDQSVKGAKKLIPESASTASGTKGNAVSGSSATGVTTADVGGSIMLFFAPIFEPIFKILSLFSTSMGTDPIVFIALLGAQCLGLSFSIFLTYVTGVVSTYAIFTVCKIGQEQTVDPIVVFERVADSVRPVILTISVGFFAAGAGLVYYVPMFPFFIYLFAIVGWFIAVIEGMAAVSLVCLGLTHPEGHDFLGKSDKAIMLVLGLFLRPVLIVIGLIAAMILSFVMFQVLIYSFAFFLQTLFLGYNATQGWTVLTAATVFTGTLMLAIVGQNPLAVIIVTVCTIPIVCILFLNIVVTITEQCYQLIFILPDYVMRWIGMSQQPFMSSQQMAQQVKGELEGATKQMTDTAQEIGRERMRHQKDAENKVKDEQAKGEHEVSTAQRKAIDGITKAAEDSGVDGVNLQNVDEVHAKINQLELEARGQSFQDRFSRRGYNLRKQKVALTKLRDNLCAASSDGQGKNFKGPNAVGLPGGDSAS